MSGRIPSATLTRSRMTTRLAPLALALLFAPLASSAQTGLDDSAAPRQGTLQASSSRMAALDLQISPEAENPVDRCGGYFTLGAPDAAVEWGGGGQAMRVWVRSALDGVLIVQAPTGETLCEDDTEGVQPAIQIAQAPAGRYAVWVGAFTTNIDASPTATLYAGAAPPAPTLAPEASAPRLAFEGADVSLVQDRVLTEHAAQTLGLPSVCPGFISPAPTARVTGEPPYTVTATSGADLVLAVRTASGEWLCDDDSGEGRDPALEIMAMGEHTVWVGTFRGHARGEAPEATLRMTGDPVVEDIMVDIPPPPPPSARSYFSEGAYTPLNLTSRGTSLPLAARDETSSISILARGDVNNPVSGDACAGALPTTPSATVEFAGAGPLTLTAEAVSGDMVMVAQAASGEWYCSDDASGQDPAIEIANPAGDVKVWVGTFSLGGSTQATLTAHRAELVSVLPEDAQIYEDYIEDMMEEPDPYSSGVYSGSGLTPEASLLAVTRDAETEVSVGGTVPNPVAGDACAGFVSASPSASFASSADVVSFLASSDSDLTMTVRTPSGDWYCSDDYDGLYPGIEVSSGGDGEYSIWLGTFSPLTTRESAQLLVREGPLLPSR